MVVRLSHTPIEIVLPFIVIVDSVMASQTDLSKLHSCDIKVEAEKGDGKDMVSRCNTCRRHGSLVKMYTSHLTHLTEKHFTSLISLAET